MSSKAASGDLIFNLLRLKWSIANVKCICAFVFWLALLDKQDQDLGQHDGMACTKNSTRSNTQIKTQRKCFNCFMLFSYLALNYYLASCISYIYCYDSVHKTMYPYSKYIVAVQSRPRNYNICRKWLFDSTHNS